MTIESNWWFYPVPPDTVPTPITAFAFFLSDGTDSTVSGPTIADALYKKDSAGAVTPLIPVAYTDEAAQDAVGGILANTSSVTLTYNDATPSISAAVPAEYVQDVVGAFVVAAAGAVLVVTYDDTANTLTIGPGSGFTEAVQDAAGAALGTTSTVALTYNDAGNAITADVVTEGIQDLVGAFISAADATITVTYSDVGNTLTIGVGTITSAKVSDFTEAAQDAVGAALTDTATIDTTYNDGANTMTFDVINDSIGLTKLANMTDSQVIGQVFGSGSADPVYLTRAQQAQIENGGIATRALVANVTIAGSTSEATLATFTLPAGSLAIGDSFRIHLGGAMSATAAAVTTTVRIKVNAVLVAASGKATTAVVHTNNSFTIDATLTVRSIGAGGTCVGDIDLDGLTYTAGAYTTPGIAVNTAPTTPIAIDTTVARDVTVTIQNSATTLTGTVLTGTITKV